MGLLPKFCCIYFWALRSIFLFKIQRIHWLHNAVYRMYFDFFCILHCILSIYALIQLPKKFHEFWTWLSCPLSVYQCIRRHYQPLSEFGNLQINSQKHICCFSTYTSVKRGMDDSDMVVYTFTAQREDANG